MNTLECIKTRRSIRKFKPDSVDHAALESPVYSTHRRAHETTVDLVSRLLLAITNS